MDKLVEEIQDQIKAACKKAGGIPCERDIDCKPKACWYHESVALYNSIQKQTASEIKKGLSSLIGTAIELSRNDYSEEELRTRLENIIKAYWQGRVE